MSDRLDILKGQSHCPNCGAISPAGNSRCPECGTFHSVAHLEERDAPPPSQRIENKPIDPSSYSLNPHETGPDENFDGDEDTVVKWSGGSADFTLEEE